MTKNERLEKFAKLVGNEPSNFKAKLDYFKTNKKRLDQSAKVAVSVLDALKDKGWSQKDLAEKMSVSAQQVNKILKGQENMTFETIDKLETALGIVLMEIVEYKSANEIKVKLESKKAIKESWSEVFVKNKSSLRKPSDELEKKIVRKLTVVHNINYKKTANAYPIAM
jgi:transcriptional regulator with XRE-family HTH domain